MKKLMVLCCLVSMFVAGLLVGFAEAQNVVVEDILVDNQGNLLVIINKKEAGDKIHEVRSWTTAGSKEIDFDSLSYAPVYESDKRIVFTISTRVASQKSAFLFIIGSADKKYRVKISSSRADNKI